MTSALCTSIEIGPNLTAFLFQLLIVLGGLAAAYRGQSIVREHASRSSSPDGAST